MQKQLIAVLLAGGIAFAAQAADFPKEINITYVKAPFNLQNIVMKEQGLLEKAFEKDGVDTLKIARALLADLEHKNLTYLCGYYQIARERAHRASDDACAAMELYRRLAAEFPDSPAELFAPKQLVYKCKKQGPITPAQKGYLNDLIKYHKITLSVQIDTLTKNEASRIIDRIISEHGRIVR